jgi:hypothetical protein
VGEVCTIDLTKERLIDGHVVPEALVSTEGVILARENAGASWDVPDHTDQIVLKCWTLE